MRFFSIGYAAHGRVQCCGHDADQHVNAFYDDVVRGLDAAAAEFRDSGLTALRRSMRGYSEEAYLAVIDELMAVGIQALVLAPINSKLITRRVNQLVKKGIPVN